MFDRIDYSTTRTPATQSISTSSCAIRIGGMCGRYVLARTDVAEVFSIDTVDDGLPPPSYNIAPSQQIPIIINSSDPLTRRLVSARWGLIPRFATSLTSGPTPFNARVEKLDTSPLYRGLIHTQRAIIPAEGFYERRATDKQSFYIHPSDDTLLGFAGLYTWWKPSEQPNSGMFTATIITCDAQAQMTSIHHRQPLCLTPDLWEEWLDRETPCQHLIETALNTSMSIAETLDYRTIGTDWLSTRPGQRNDNPNLITELKPDYNLGLW